jgi:beta-galactosidase
MIFTTTISNPRLWNGTIDPYLYNVKLEIYHDNELYHKYERPYGLRFYEYVINQTVNGNSYTGFLLNGQPYLLRGVCMHDDLEGKANALTVTDINNDFTLIHELGCNFIRLAHYPHPKEVYDKCDQLGIVVQTEAPWVNKSKMDMPEDYWTHLEGQMTDMVNQHYNHPCIMFWGVGNEINSNITDTTEGKNFVKGKIESYRNTIRTLLPGAMVGYTVSHSTSNVLGIFNNPTVDWVGGNIYVGWYIQKTSNDPTGELNKRIASATTAGVPLAFSEYGAGGTSTCHSDDFMNTTTTGNNSRHDIEYQMWLHEGYIAAIKNFPQLLFTSQWQLFDIAVTSRNEGYIECAVGINRTYNNKLRYLNNKGLVERDHVTKKDTFYLYKAWWNTTDKFVHICGKDYRKTTDRAIKCYTNDGNSLTLYVNGTSAETITVTDNIAVFTARNFNYGDTIMVSGATTSDTFTMPQYDYVEIAGTKWATMNVGATSVASRGSLYQWGDTQGYTNIDVGTKDGKKAFDWTDYKYADTTTTPGETAMTKYNSTDGKTVLESSDDAAQVYWGGNWRMPTTAEWVALGEAVNTSYVNNYLNSGVNGVLCTDKTDSSKKLFLPQTCKFISGKTESCESGMYWASSLFTDNVEKAYGAFMAYPAGERTFQTDNERRMGRAIRPILDE